MAVEEGRETEGAADPLRRRSHDLWRRFVNPDYVRVLETLGFGRAFVRSSGTKLHGEDGREYTDFLAGFGVHNIGHNHPRLIARLREVLESGEPSMLNVDAPLAAGLLAERLSGMTRPELCRAAFTSGGAEAVEVAIKAARAATGRSGLISCHGAYHGLTAGALSLMGGEGPGRRFGTLLGGVVQVPFGDVAALEEACARRRPAAFFVEPIQAEGGVRVPPEEYLREAGRACRKAGTLLVVDEIQTGLGRTGKAFATDFTEVLPDILLVGKALSGGVVPVAAAVMTAAVWSRAFSGMEKFNSCMSTFSGGRLAMAAGLAVLEILQDEKLAERADRLGAELLDGLRQLAAGHGATLEVRGKGLLAGVEFQKGSAWLRWAVPRCARDQLFAQILSAMLLEKHGFLTQPCGLAPRVLRIEPPLTITSGEIQGFLRALDDVLTICPSMGSAVLSALRKVALGRDLVSSGSPAAPERREEAAP